MRNYEIMFLLRPNLTEEERKKNIDAVRSIITDNGGEIVQQNEWGRRSLSYEIARFKEGYYCDYLFKSPHPVPTELERKIRVNESILRWIIINLDEEKERDRKMEKRRAKRNPSPTTGEEVSK